MFFFNNIYNVFNFANLHTNVYRIKAIQFKWVLYILIHFRNDDCLTKIDNVKEFNFGISTVSW